MGKRLITVLRLDELGVYSPTDEVLALKPNGTVVRTGKTVADISAGIDLESDNIDDADPNGNKFVTQGDLDKLGFIEVSEPIDLDFRQGQLIELGNADYVTEMNAIIEF